MVKTQRKFEASRTAEPMVLNVHIPVVAPAALFPWSASPVFLSRSVGKQPEQVRREFM